MSESEELRWVGGWKPVSKEDATPLEAELQRELTPGHPLYGVGVRAFGRFGRRDDVAFELADGSFAVSHLTWIGKPEQSPKYPWTELYSTAAALQARFDQDEEDSAL